MSLTACCEFVLHTVRYGNNGKWVQIGAGCVSQASKQNLKTPSPKPATMLGV